MNRARQHPKAVSPLIVQSYCPEKTSKNTVGALRKGWWDMVSAKRAGLRITDRLGCGTCKLGSRLLNLLASCTSVIAPFTSFA